jgi:hypothetical protein
VRGGVRPYHWLALLPAVGLLGALPAANRVRPFVLGLPFLLAWIVGWVLLTSAIMALILVLDQRRGVTDDDEGAPDEAGAPP